MSGVDSESIINYVRYNRETISSLSKFVRRTYRKEFTSPIYIPVLNKNKLCFNYFTGIHQDVRKESVVRIVVDSGKELKLTEDMEVYSSTVGWTRVKDIRVGDSIGTQGSPICLRCGKKRFLSGFIYRAMYKNICKNCRYTIFVGNPDGEKLYKRCLQFNLVPDTDAIVCSQFELVFENIVIMEPESKKQIGLYVTSKEPHNSFTANEILVRRRTDLK